MPPKKLLPQTPSQWLTGVVLSVIIGGGAFGAGSFTYGDMSVVTKALAETKSDVKQIDNRTHILETQHTTQELHRKYLEDDIDEIKETMKNILEELKGIKKNQ